ncbi:hypothetical protein [Clavibacter californiensis]|uniref:hypothetical protein n=1 Tax=Clavibacter californiensis TaxID=1401995 RepID=UPI001F2A68B6|nr:hypothetical protein [Clavibacter californiensis]UKF80906.1 hypothetical protein FGD68_04425 [Clavibacter californiensis]
MPSVTVRPMTPSEFAEMMAAADEDYAARQVEAGLWPAEGARERSAAETAKWLPDGIRTLRTLLLRGLGRVRLLTRRCPVPLHSRRCHD